MNADRNVSEQTTAQEVEQAMIRRALNLQGHVSMCINELEDCGVSPENVAKIRDLSVEIASMTAAMEVNQLLDRQGVKRFMSTKLDALERMLDEVSELMSPPSCKTLPDC